jgi:serine dehydrogenase proteinase
MPTASRLPIISRIEKSRGSKVVCYLTTLRPGLMGAMADDAVRHFFDHMSLLGTRPVEKLDIFLVSNGGSGTVPWRLVSLFREYTNHLGVIVPYRAYSAASLLALGADEIVMHPFAELGPIDPTVSNEYNPKDETTQQRLGISVEDVTAYVNFVKETVGIRHEDELVKAIEILASKVHPLAIGNVERFLSQSRLIARKLLKTHRVRLEDHVIDELVEDLASKLYFHGHPINRREAKADLGLTTVNSDLPPELETSVWDLYKDFETEFENQNVFSPAGDLAAADPNLTFTNLQQPKPIVQKEYDNLHVIIESARLSCRFAVRRRYSLFRYFGPQGMQAVIPEDVIQQGWNCSLVPTPPPASAPTT